MKKAVSILLIFIPLVALAVLGASYYALLPPPTDSGNATSTAAVPATAPSLSFLKLPAGFFGSVLAKVPGARVIAEDASGNLWVSQTVKNSVTLLIMKDNRLVGQKVIYQNLNHPHGLAFDPEKANILYVAEENRISWIDTSDPEGKFHKIATLPAGGEHYTRTIGFGPDGRLYVSIGSSCNVCRESNPERASIYVMNKDGSGFAQYASGLRNSVFFVWQNSRMIAADMGRDYLGDNLPPDEINIIQGNHNYGWPNCYGKNIHDTNFDKNTYVRNPCMQPFETPSYIDIPAHSAPLGLAFLSGSGWPENYQGGLLIAYHGSWNRSVRTGYKIVLFAAGGGLVTSTAADFITGWLTSKNTVLGRPVDILAQADGTLYVSDDSAGLVYKFSYKK